MQALRNCINGGLFRYGSLLGNTGINGSQVRNFSQLTPTTQGNPSTLLQTASLLATFMRTNVRDHFPKPSEVKRIRKHGLKRRLSTPGGRMVIIRRICRGRFVLSH